MQDQPRDGASAERVVKSLIEAENGRDRNAADQLLSKDFAGITRAKGREDDRATLLDAIAKPEDPPVHRQLESVDIWKREAPGLCIVRSIVATDGPKPGRFRNIHVLVREDGAWRCLAWQVTRLNT